MATYSELRTRSCETITQMAVCHFHDRSTFYNSMELIVLIKTCQHFTYYVHPLFLQVVCT